MARWLPRRGRPDSDATDPTFGSRFAGSYVDGRAKVLRVFLTKRLPSDPVRQGGLRVRYHLVRHSRRELATGQARLWGRWRLLAAGGVVGAPGGFAQPDIAANRLRVEVDDPTPRTATLVRRTIPWIPVLVQPLPGPRPVPAAERDLALTDRLTWYRWRSATTTVDGIAPPTPRAAQRLTFRPGYVGAGGCNTRGWRAAITRQGTLVLANGGYTTLVGCPAESGDDHLDKILSSRPTFRLDGHTLTLRSPAGEVAFVADLSLPRP